MSPTEKGKPMNFLWDVGENTGVDLPRGVPRPASHHCAEGPWFYSIPVNIGIR
jgi:hypothetical protein